jgi:hypothetical protein
MLDESGGALRGKPERCVPVKDFERVSSIEPHLVRMAVFQEPQYVPELDDYAELRAA